MTGRPSRCAVRFITAREGNFGSLNDTELSPFALLSMLETNGLITVSRGNGSFPNSRVYANELLGTNDKANPAAAAGQEANSLFLMTCENKSIKGGYLNHRVVYAKP